MQRSVLMFPPLILAFRSMLLCLLLAILSACVVTKTGGFTEKADKGKALVTTVQLAYKYIGERNWGAAKRHLKAALEIDSQSAEVHEALALVFQNTGEIALAEQHYTTSLNIDPTLSRARQNYAGYLYHFNRFNEAAQQLEMVVTDTLYDHRTEAYARLGRCYVRLNDLEKAKVNLMQAFMMSGKRDRTLMFDLADVYYQLEEYGNARRFYEGYRLQARQQPARALLLGARLARQFDDKDTISSYGLALKNLYPTSQEYVDFKGEFGYDY